MRMNIKSSRETPEPSTIDFYKVENVSDRWAIGFTQEGDKEPTVWFLDKKYPFEESHGITFQNTGACYYVSTIANHEGMLDLWGDIPAWKVPADVMDIVRPICEEEYSIWKTNETDILQSRKISSSQKRFENVVEGTQYDDYHIDTNGQAILDVEYIIDSIESRGNQAVLTIQCSDGTNYHTYVPLEDWKEFKDLKNNSGVAITDVWITEVEGGSYVHNSCKPIKSARFLVEDENGEIIGEADTYEEAETLGGAKIVDSESQDNQEEGLFQSRKITSANNYGWIVDSSDAMKAYDMWVDYVGKESAVEDLARALSSDDLEENLEWICQQRGFAEDIEDVQNPWDKYEIAKEYIGYEELSDDLSQAVGYDELAECMAYIFRMNDFQEWNGESEEDYE